VRADGQAARVGVLARVAHRLGQHRLRERLERRGHAGDRALDADAEVRVLDAQPVELGRERRVRRRRRAPERALQRRAQLAERGAHLDRAARPCLGAQRLLGRQRQRDAEQALHDAVVDVAREVDALLELARALAVVRRDPRRRRERERLAEHPQQLPARLVDRRRAGGRLGEDDADPAARGDDRHVHERVVADELREVVGDVMALGREHLDHAILGQRSARDRRRLDGHVSGREAVEREPVRTTRLDAPAGVVVAEDHGPIHARDPADRLGETRVELLRPGLLVDAAEDVAQQLERGDRVRGGGRRSGGRRRGVHAFIVTHAAREVCRVRCPGGL
jgi:hypothetical protein